MVGWRSFFGAVLAVAAGGCSIDPTAPLIPTPPRPATMSPSQAPATTADGFPNILADPVTVNGGLPRPQREVDAEMASLARSRTRSQAATNAIPRTNFAPQLARQARTSVEDARAQIAASGRADSGAPRIDPNAAIEEARRTIAASGSRERTLPPPGAAAAPAAVTAPAAPAADSGQPIDPAAPLPRAVGPTP